MVIINTRLVSGDGEESLFIFQIAKKYIIMGRVSLPLLLLLLLAADTWGFYLPGQPNRQAVERSVFKSKPKDGNDKGSGEKLLHVSLNQNRS